MNVILTSVPTLHLENSVVLENNFTFLLSSEQPQTINGTTIYFRGFRILKAILNNLLLAGLSTSEQVILTGCSGMNTLIPNNFL